MAAELGLTHEATYRALARLERDGRMVREERGHVLQPVTIAMREGDGGDLGPSLTGILGS